jgi:hypothetical protein
MTSIGRRPEKSADDTTKLKILEIWKKQVEDRVTHMLAAEIGDNPALLHVS